MRKRGYTIYCICMFLFWLFAFAGMKLEKEGNIVWNGSFVTKLLIQSLILGVISGILLVEMLLLMDKRIPKNKQINRNEKKSKWTIFFASWMLIMLAWIPVFLAYYPGNCTYDISGQTWYIASHYYEEYHPLAHTLLMEGFIDIGQLIGNVNLGMAGYVLFQMLCLSSSFSYGISLLYSIGRQKACLIVLQLWSMFFLPNLFLSVSTSKDVIFSSSVLYMILFLFHMIRDYRNSLKVDRFDIGFTISTIMMILFRNNGKYAFLITIGFGVLLMIFTHKARKLYSRITLLCLVSFLFAGGCLMALRYITDAAGAPKQEMLSMPVQQLSRVMIYHGGTGVLDTDDNTLEEADKNFINDFIKNEAYKKYIPSVSDPVKSEADPGVIRFRAAEFISVYCHLLSRYPSEFINAALAVNAGYLNPFDMTHTDVYTWGAAWLRVGWSPYEEIGLSQDSKLPWLYRSLTQFADANTYVNIPLLGYFVMPGGYLWFSLLIAAWLLWKKKYRYLFLFTFILGYYLTMLLGPTVQLRYIYPVMVSLPFILLGISTERNTNDL